MAFEPVYLPDAKDIDNLAITPKRELESCNHLLDDHDALMKFHDEEGYILLRNVFDPSSVEEARKAMFAVMERWGLIEPGATEAIWTGKPFAGGMEESPEFAGIAGKLMRHPVNAAVMAKILGEPACLLPIVQYRTYPPGGSITPIHQDGYFSPGILNYKPVWTPLTKCERELGGLMLAVRQCNRGYFHNTAKMPPSIPEGLIPEDSWATTDYMPGDALIVHPGTPHASMPNTSKRCRVTLDTRVQSAANPRAITGAILEATDDMIRVRDESGKERSFIVNDESYIRIGHPGVREKRLEYAKNNYNGKSIVVVFEGDVAKTLRQASEN